MSVRLKLKISVTAEPNGLYSSGNIPTGFKLFSWKGVGTPPTPAKSKNITPLNFFPFFVSNCKLIGLYSLGNIPTGHVVVLTYFLGGRGRGRETPPPSQKIKKNPLNFFYIFIICKNQ